LQCDDDRGVFGTDRARFFDEASSLIPEPELPLRPDVSPPPPVALDLLDLVSQRVSALSVRDYHPYFGHDHLRFNGSKGLAFVRERAESIFARNGVAVTVGVDGLVIRLIPASVEQVVGALPPYERAIPASMNS
jgi:hypothetical protein